MFAFFLLSEPSKVNLALLIGHRYWGHLIYHPFASPFYHRGTCSVTSSPDQPLTCQLVLLSQLFDLIEIALVLVSTMLHVPQPTLLSNKMSSRFIFTLMLFNSLMKQLAASCQQHNDGTPLRSS